MAVPTYPAGPTASDSTVSELQDLHRKAKGVRDRFIPDWYVNLAFYLGQQWLYWNRGRLDRPRLADWRQTPVDNRILPVVDGRVARKVKNRPSFICTPYTADEADIEASRIGEKVLDADWDVLNMQERLYMVMQFAEICGAGFWKIYWDPSKGKTADFLFDAEGQPVTQGNGQPVRADALQQVPAGMATQPVATGDVCVDVLSPFEFYPDPLATSLNECEWVIEEKVRSLSYVRERFDIDPVPDAGAPIGPVEGRLFSSLTWSAGEAEEYKGVRVFEYWAKASSEYPDGKRCVWLNDQIVREDSKPFDPSPYVMFEGLKAPNRFWPTTLVTQLRGPQTMLNKTLAQLQENQMRIGNPSLMKSRHANVKYTGLPGEEILYDSTVQDAVPSYLQPPEMPVYIREQVDRLINSIAEISGVHDVSKAQVPTGVTAASAINLLQEADDTRIGPEIQAMETALALAGTKVLKLRARFNTDERLIRIAGEDGNWDIFSFRGQLLGNDPNVEVQAGSAMPRSKAAKQAAMTEILSMAFQYGLQFDSRDLRRFFKDYEVGGLERLFESISYDESQVQRENRQMSQGAALNINDWDNDDVHITGHDEFRKSARFERLPVQIQQIFDLHVRAHRERQVQIVNSQMSAMSTEQGQQMQLEQQAQLEQADQQAAHQQALQNQQTNGGAGS